MGTWSPITTRYLSPDRCGMWPMKDVKCNCTNRRRTNKPPSPTVSNVDTKLATSRESHSVFLKEEAGQARGAFPEHLLGADICKHAIPFPLGLDSKKWVSSVPFQDEGLRAGSGLA